MDMKRLMARLRDIAESNGIDREPDPSNLRELEYRRKQAVAMTQENIRNAVNKMKQARKVDICFLIDATGSMADHISGTKDSIHKIINTLFRSRNQPAGLERLRMAVVAYRDFGDNSPIEQYDFSEDADDCIAFCRSLEATGGGDPCENVFGGLKIATQLNWSQTAGTRIIFHICDAPCHGREYHSDDIGDDYPNGDPEGLSEAVLFKKIKDLNIDYYFGEISKTTTKMLQRFAIAYGRIVPHFDVQGIAQIADSIIQSISLSVEVNSAQAKSISGASRTPSVTIDTSIPDWRGKIINEGYYTEFLMPHSTDDIVKDGALQKRLSAPINIKKAAHPFAFGSESVVYYAVEVSDSNEKWMVLKEPKQELSTDMVRSRCETSCEVQTIAAYFANQFNSLINCEIKINFNAAKTLTMTSQMNRTMICETYLGGQDVFFKFTNNLNYTMGKNEVKLMSLGFSSKIIDILTAFSHWTWKETNGFLTIVDLQGIILETQDKRQTNVWLTDPAIHCQDVLRFYPTNLGQVGIREFFKYHRCNSFCCDFQRYNDG